MSEKNLVSAPQQEYPFPIPRLKGRHFIPGAGLFLYINDLLEARGESWREEAEGLLQLDARAILSLGVSTWPKPKSDTEFRQGMRVASRHGALLGYHAASGMVVLDLGLRVAKQLVETLNK